MGGRTAALVGVLWLVVSTAGAWGADRYLIVRYDDYGPLSPYTSAADTGRSSKQQSETGSTTAPDLEARLFEMFEQHRARLVVGVIPLPMRTAHEPARPPATVRMADSWLADPGNAWVTLLREYVTRGTVEPALHGYEHRRRTASNHRPGEFGEQGATWQLEAIRFGRDALGRALGSNVGVFVPPWNSWDKNTARALDTLGFAWCSCDTYHAGYKNAGVRFVPQTAGHPDEVLTMLRSRQEVPPGSIVVLTTHPFDFAGVAGEHYFQSLERLLDTVSGDPGWACVGLSDLPAASVEEWHARFRRAVAWQGLRELASDMYGLSRLAPGPTGAYWPTSVYSERTWPLAAAVGGALLGSAALGGLFGGLIVRLPGGGRGVARVAAALSLVAMLVLVAGAILIEWHGYQVRGIRWQAVCVAAGLSLGLSGIRPWRQRHTAGSRQGAMVEEGTYGDDLAGHV